MSEKFSDVIIVGTDLAGLIAGAFLAKRGMAVTVLESEKNLDFEKRNVHPNFLTHLESRLFKSILGRLSITDRDLNIVRRLEVPYQVLLPKHRIDIFRNREKMLRELKREFPQDAETLTAFYEKMDHFDETLDSEKLQELMLPKTLRQRWDFYQFIKANQLDRRISEYTESLGGSEVIHCFLESQTKFLSQTHAKNPFTYQIAKSLGNDNCLLFEIKGGLGHLKQVFLDKIEYYNGKVKQDAVLEGLQFKRSWWRQSVSSVALGFEGQHRCRYLLWNDEAHKLKAFLPDQWRNRFLLKRIAAVPPKFYRFSAQFSVDPGVVPVGMKENSLLIEDPNAELQGVNFLQLNLYHPSENLPGMKSVLTVSYFLPADKLYESVEYFEDLHQTILKKLIQLMPFSSGGVAMTFPRTEFSASEETLFPMEKSDYEIFRQNAAQHPIDEIDPQRFSQLWTMGHRTPYQNLFLTSREILAPLGLEGNFLLGLKTIDLIWEEAELARKRVTRQRRVIS